MADFWVFEVSGGGWHVKADGARLACSRHLIADDAVAAASALIADSGGGELILKRRLSKECERHAIPPTQPDSFVQEERRASTLALPSAVSARAGARPR